MAVGSSDDPAPEVPTPEGHANFQCTVDSAEKNSVPPEVPMASTSSIGLSIGVSHREYVKGAVVESSSPDVPVAIGAMTSAPESPMPIGAITSTVKRLNGYIRAQSDRKF